MESSRIFVRGLPPNFVEDDVRRHFSKYPITDVRYFPARRFGYVGYKSPSDASKAVKYFNKSFIRMSKIFVELAKPVADESLPKSQKQRKEEKRAPKHTDHVPPPKENQLKRKRADEGAEQNPKLKEFLEVMQPPSKAKTWANEDAQLESGTTHAAGAVEEVTVPGGDSDEEYQVVKKSRTQSTKQPSVEASPAPDVAEAPTALEAEDEHVENSMQVAPVAMGLVSDADWLRTRTNRVLDLVDVDEAVKLAVVPDSPFAQADEKVEVEGAHVSPDMQVDQLEGIAHSPLSEEDKIRQTGRLYLRNLSYDVTKDDLDDHFSKYGALEEVHCPMKKSDGKGKGFAFLQFEDSEHAVNAWSNNDGKTFQGRLLHIIPAETKKASQLNEFEIAKLPLKKQREIARRKNSAGSFNWNSLYLNADSVVTTIAARMGVSKADLLDPTSSDAAVRQAKSETHLISEIRSYFAQHSIDLEAFKRSARGDTAILVKNIPPGAQNDIRKLFEEHGTLRRFLMPPAGLIAIVEYPNSAQASSAFSSLAYRKVRDGILYLEKAPKDLFSLPEGAAPSPAPQVSSETQTKLSATDLLQDAPEPDSSNTGTLYIRNLDFSTTTQRLSEAFSPLEGFRSARVKTKIDPKRGVLSMGYGFVEFSDSQTAAVALKTMDGHKLEGHQLQIKASHRGADAAEEIRKEDAAKKAGGTKIIIKNLPFEATKKDVRSLFSPYGALRSCRVPKKFDNSSRGFGFVEYGTKRDAANAMAALAHTHLLGRRLVLAFAEAEANNPEREIEKMQQKVGAQSNKVALQQLTGGGRKKFNVAGNDDLDEA